MTSFVNFLEFVDDVTDDLGSREELEHINTILVLGNPADEQLRVWRETGEIKTVVDHLIHQTMEHVPCGVMPTALAATS